MAISQNVLNSIKKSKKKNGIITYVELNNSNDKNSPTDPKNEIYNAFKKAVNNRNALNDVQKILEALWDDGGHVSVLNNKELVYISKDGSKTETITFNFDNNGNIVIKKNNKEVIKFGTPEKVIKNVGWKEEKIELKKIIDKARDHKDFMKLLESYLKGIIY